MTPINPGTDSTVFEAIQNIRLWIYKVTSAPPYVGKPNTKALSEDNLRELNDLNTDNILGIIAALECNTRNKIYSDWHMVVTEEDVFFEVQYQTGRDWVDLATVLIPKVGLA